MGKDGKSKDAGKGKGKQAAGGGDEGASKGKGKGGAKADGLGTCTYVKGRHLTQLFPLTFRLSYLFDSASYSNVHECECFDVCLN